MSRSRVWFHEYWRDRKDPLELKPVYLLGQKPSRRFRRRARGYRLMAWGLAFLLPVPIAGVMPALMLLGFSDGVTEQVALWITLFGTLLLGTGYLIRDGGDPQIKFRGRREPVE